MAFWRAKKVYYDPYTIQEEFPDGIYEIWTAKEGYEGALERSILSRTLTRGVFWEKQHTLVRVKVLKWFTVVCAWKKEWKKPAFNRMNGIISLGIGRLVVNLVKEEKKKQ